MAVTMFDPLLLRSFVAVVDCANFTRAAQRLHLTQSTVSQQIRRLEDSLGCKLLDREQRRVMATPKASACWSTRAAFWPCTRKPERCLWM